MFPTAQNNNLIQENAARAMFRFPSEFVPPLLELAARAVVRWKLPIRHGSIPRHLEGTHNNIYIHTYTKVITLSAILQMPWLPVFSLRVTVAKKFYFTTFIMLSCLTLLVPYRPLAYLTGCQYCALSVLKTA